MRGFYAGVALGAAGCFSSPGGPPLLVYGDGGRPDLTSATGADGGAASAGAAHNLAVLNMYRAQAGAPALTLDDQLNAFATVGSTDLAQGGAPHAHFVSASNDGSIWQSGFCSNAAENQAPGWSLGASLEATIDDALASMMAEGPGGGHHDAIVDPQSRRVGVGLVESGGALYLTNDFSPPCP